MHLRGLPAVGILAGILRSTLGVQCRTNFTLSLNVRHLRRTLTFGRSPATPKSGGGMDEAREIAEQLRSAELELQLAQRAYDGTPQARQRYAEAIREMELIQRRALRNQRSEVAR